MNPWETLVCPICGEQDCIATKNEERANCKGCNSNFAVRPATRGEGHVIDCWVTHSPSNKVNRRLLDAHLFTVIRPGEDSEWLVTEESGGVLSVELFRKSAPGTQNIWMKV